MSKKHQHRLKELQRLKAMHSAESIGIQPVMSSGTVDDEGVAPIVPSGSQVHSEGAHLIVRKDLGLLGLVTGGLVVALFVIYWLTIKTGLDDKIISLMQRVG